jgi:hypothetical protein
MPLSGRGCPARGLTIGTAEPVGPTAYPGGMAGRAAGTPGAAGAPGKGGIGTPGGAAFPRMILITGVPATGGTPGAFALPTEFGVLSTGAE